MTGTEVAVLFFTVLLLIGMSMYLVDWWRRDRRIQSIIDKMNARDASRADPVFLLPADAGSKLDPLVPTMWEYSAALRNPDGSLVMVGANESDDETQPFMLPARERVMEHYRAWTRYSPETIAQIATPDATVVLVRRAISPWEEIQP